MALFRDCSLLVLGDRASHTVARLYAGPFPPALGTLGTQRHQRHVHTSLARTAGFAVSYHPARVCLFLTKSCWTNGRSANSTSDF